MTESAALTDEQVEQILNALLDFRDMLVSLTERFHQRLAVVEQDIALRRQAPMPVASEDPVLKTLDRSAKPELSLLDAEAKFNALEEKEEKEEVYDLTEGEEFSLMDFDDDDEDF